MSADESNNQKIAWGQLVMVTIGAVLFLAGAWRFGVGHRFGLMDALYCCLAVVPAGLLLLVFDYVLHHAKLVSIIPLFLAGMLAVTSPIFDVALGLAVMGAVGGPALREWKDERRKRKSTLELNDEKR